MNSVHLRFKRFHLKRLQQRKGFSFRGATVITYDAVSKIHVVTRDLLSKASKASGLDVPPFVSTSLPKLKHRMFSKRSVLNKVKSFINTTEHF